jgi:hypothetical protein
MSRNLKALGLALIAVLALSGVAAVAAQAETAIESELKAPAVTKLDVINDPTGKPDDGARLTIGNGARFVECEVFDFTGTLTGSATTVKGTVEYTKCYANEITTSPVTVTHNKCELTITPLKDSTATTTVSCPKGTPQEIQIHVFENEKAEKENKVLCTYDVTIPEKGQIVTGAKITTAGAAGKTHALTAALTGSSKLKEIFNTGPGGLAVCGVAVSKHAEGAFSTGLIISGTEAANPATQVGITLI